MREIALPDGWCPSEGATFAACLATVLEIPVEDVPEPMSGEDPLGVRVSRWLGGLGLGLVPVAGAHSFSWAGPWIGWVRRGDADDRLAVVMYGVPPGVVWDPSGVTRSREWQLDGGLVVSALDIATARPALPVASASVGLVVGIYISSSAGRPVQGVERVEAFVGGGLAGDRYSVGMGSFASGFPGSALTLIEREVCDSFAPALEANEHRRNVETSGIELNGLVGHEFWIGEVHCRGIRLCEPCKVMNDYSSRQVLRPLVHRGGLRADVLGGGQIAVGMPVRTTR